MGPCRPAGRRIGICRDGALPEGWVWADRAALEHTYALPSALAPFRSAAEEGLL